MIAEKQSYSGRCMLCTGVFDKSQMKRHLNTCMAAGRVPKPVQSVNMFHLVIEGKDMPMYWMYR